MGVKLSELIQSNIYSTTNGERDGVPMSIMNYLNVVGMDEGAVVIDALLENGVFDDGNGFQVHLTKEKEPVSKSSDIIFCDGHCYTIRL